MPQPEPEPEELLFPGTEVVTSPGGTMKVNKWHQQLAEHGATTAFGGTLAVDKRPPASPQVAAAKVGLGRIAAPCHRSSTLYHIH